MAYRYSLGTEPGKAWNKPFTAKQRNTSSAQSGDPEAMFARSGASAVVLLGPNFHDIQIWEP